jgi:hypothetical protein
MLFELNPETIKFNNMFDGEEISGYLGKLSLYLIQVEKLGIKVFLLV